MSTSKNLSKEKQAIKILLKKQGYAVISNNEKKTLHVAFARCGLVIHKRAFDLVRTTKKVNFLDEKDIMKNKNNITFIELKSTDKNLDSKFSGHWFGLTMRQIIMGQTYKDHYKFVFVNIKNGNILEMTLKELYSRMKWDLVGHVVLD